MPYERHTSNTPTRKPRRQRKTPPTYRKLSAESKRLIAFGKSVMESLSSLDSREELEELSHCVRAVMNSEEDVIEATDDSETEQDRLQSAYTVIIPLLLDE